jgi:ribosomal protein S18 acetylase RimI-like enzyme
MTLQLVRQPPADWPGLAPLIHTINQRANGGVHCLHAAAGADVAAQAAELAALPPDEAAFWLVTHDGRRCGVVGCEFDPALRRAWMRGPLVDDAKLLDALLPVVTPTLDAALPGIAQFDAFPAADAAALNGWYAAAGYQALLLHRVLSAPSQVVLAAGAVPPPARVRRATPADLAPTLALHASLFPQSYLGEADFTRALDAPDRACFVADAADVAGTGSIAGYIHVQDSEAEQEAYVDYLGVAPSQRGRGLGRALLGAAAAWGAERGRSSVGLTVREDSRSALGLYVRAGFTEVSAGRHWRRTRHGA